MNKVNWFNIIKTMVGLTPFKGFLPKFYVGKVRIGTPHFLPRKWIDNPEKEGYLKVVPRQFGFDIVPLGWKWKYDSLRHEFNPIISFVIWKLQIAVMFVPPHDMHYWESWLNYVIKTPSDSSTKERVKMLIKEYPNVWVTHKDGKDTKMDYLKLSLKKKWTYYEKT